MRSRPSITIYMQNSWVNRGEPSIALPKRNIHGNKLLRCILWDWKGVLYYELLQPNETITVERCSAEMIHLRDPNLRKNGNIRAVKDSSSDYHLLK